MTITLEIFSDYVCPYCFLAEEPLRDALSTAGEDLDIRWMPFELRPYPTPTLEPEGDYLQTGWARSVFPMAEAMGVPIVLPKVSPQPYTRLAFEGHLFAAAAGKSAEYTHRMFTAFFQDEIDIGNVEALTELAAELGLDAEAFAQSLDEGEYAAEHVRLLRYGTQELQIRAVPTFMVGGLKLEGVVPAETLAAAIQRASGSKSN
jgi:predicted DsbA family dithiol-disulfide isomerase